MISLLLAMTISAPPQAPPLQAPHRCYCTGASDCVCGYVCDCPQCKADPDYVRRRPPQAPPLAPYTPKSPTVCPCTGKGNCTCDSGRCACVPCLTEPVSPRPPGDGWQWDYRRQLWWRPLPEAVPYYQPAVPSFRSGITFGGGGGRGGSC